MGQKTNPISNRLGIIRGWDSNWFGGKNYVSRILEDFKVREYINKRFLKSSISHIYIERTLKLITITITTSKPGLIIGKGGKEVDSLREELKKITNKDIQINIFEIRNSFSDACILAKDISNQISNRISYKKIIRISISDAKRSGIEGIKIKISGRLNGVEMARSETYKYGRIPLSTFRADIDYAVESANTTYGVIGIKVWIMKGEIFSKRRDLSQLIGFKKRQKR